MGGAVGGEGEPSGHPMTDRGRGPGFCWSPFEADTPVDLPLFSVVHILMRGG
jgi:hypothetical protein